MGRDLGRVTHYVALDSSNGPTEDRLLNRCFPSQLERGWWDDETFGAILRLRGVECRSRYAEGFVVNKQVLRVDGGP